MHHGVRDSAIMATLAIRPEEPRQPQRLSAAPPLAAALLNQKLMLWLWLDQG